jgi:hypothetical protein
MGSNYETRNLELAVKIYAVALSVMITKNPVGGHQRFEAYPVSIFKLKENQF